MTDDFRLSEIGQVSRTVADIDAATIWYRDVLGLTFLFSAGTLAFFDCAGTRLFLSQKQDGAAANESILYMRVADIHAAHTALLARGVTFIQDPSLIHTSDDGVEEWMAFFQDPDGRPLAIMSQVAAT